nr:hypothetical protein [Peptostreptococcus sp. D1]
MDTVLKSDDTIKDLEKIKSPHEEMKENSPVVITDGIIIGATIWKIPCNLL